MITDKDHLDRAIENLEKFKLTLDAFKARKAKLVSDEELLDLEISIGQYEGKIEQFNKEILEYHELNKGNSICLSSAGLEELPNCLIKTRIKSKLSQKQLGEMLGISQQQIARYEASSYSTASYERIKEIARVLNIDFVFEPIIHFGEDVVPLKMPSSMTEAMVKQNAEEIRHSKKLLKV